VGSVLFRSRFAVDMVATVMKTLIPEGMSYRVRGCLGGSLGICRRA
jgi:hypothetical protein